MRKWIPGEPELYIHNNPVLMDNFYWGRVPLCQWFNAIEVMSSGQYTIEDIALHAECSNGRAHYMERSIRRAYIRKKDHSSHAGNMVTPTTPTNKVE